MATRGLLESLVAGRTTEALLGDLIEQYQGGRSRTWYWGQVLQALVISASREVRNRKLQSVSAIIIGCATALPLCHALTSLAARFVGGYKASRYLTRNTNTNAPTKRLTARSSHSAMWMPPLIRRDATLRHVRTWRL